MRRIVCALAALMLSCGICAAQAESVDLSDMKLPSLYALRDQVNARIAELEQGGRQSVYESGTYLVGRDIPEGDYLLMENEDAMFASVIVRENCSESANLISHNLINRQCVMRLAANTCLTLSEASACPIEEARPIEDQTTGEGGYLVGPLLPAGSYAVKPVDNAPLSSYSVYDGILGTGAQLIKFEVLHGIVNIELGDGEYIELSGCTLGPAVPEQTEETP